MQIIKELGETDLSLAPPLPLRVFFPPKVLSSIQSTQYGGGGRGQGRITCPAVLETATPSTGRQADVFSCSLCENSGIANGIGWQVMLPQSLLIPD